MKNNKIKKSKLSNFKNKLDFWATNSEEGGEVERLEAEINRLQLLSDTVQSALVESRKQQQIVHQKINNLTTNDGMAKIKQWKIELKAAEEKLQKINTAISSAKNTLIANESS